MSRHIKAVHDGICLPCDQCNKSFNDGSVLTKHKKRIHEGILQHSAETIAESITDYELKEEVEENKPVKNIEYVGIVDVNNTEIQPYCNLCQVYYTCSTQYSPCINTQRCHLSM